VLMSFKRNGKLFEQPRITFQSGDPSDAERASYRTAVAETLKRCASLPFTEALGNALAGAPLTMRFVDDRERPPRIWSVAARRPSPRQLGPSARAGQGDPSARCWRRAGRDAAHAAPASASAMAWRCEAPRRAFIRSDCRRQALPLPGCSGR
jgi:hypothetical protein